MEYNPNSEVKQLLSFFKSHVGEMKIDEDYFEKYEAIRYCHDYNDRAESRYVTITLSEDGYPKDLYIIHRMTNLCDKTDSSVQKLTMCNTFIDVTLFEKALDITRIL